LKFLTASCLLLLFCVTLVTDVYSALQKYKIKLNRFWDNFESPNLFVEVSLGIFIEDV
jgi:hypothetical protein